MSAYPQFKTLSDISRYHSVEHADRLALVFNDRSTDYKTLDVRTHVSPFYCYCTFSEHRFYGSEIMKPNYWDSGTKDSHSSPT